MPLARSFDRVPPRVVRVAALTATGVLLVFVAAEVYVGITVLDWGTGIGNDFSIYMAGAHRWLGGGDFYLPRQLAGPYPIQVGDLLYPPTALYLFVPFAFLPAPAWWAVPIGLAAWVIRSWRPAIWSWPLMAACLAWPYAPLQFITGNPALWIMAAVACGLRWGWPGALVLLKPSVFPFALVGIRRRSWWLMLAALMLLTLPLAPMLPDWLHAVFDGRGWGGYLYSLRDIPLLLIPLVASAGRANPKIDG